GTQFGIGMLRCKSLQLLENRIFQMQRLQLVLSEKCLRYVVTGDTLTFKRLYACDDSQQCRLTPAVCSDQRNFIAFLNYRVCMFQNDIGRVGFADILYADYVAARLLAESKGEVNARILIVYVFDPLHLIEHLNT